MGVGYNPYRPGKRGPKIGTRYHEKQLGRSQRRREEAYTRPARTNLSTRNATNPLLPSAVTLMGEAGEFVVCDPMDDALYVVTPRPASVLVAANDREMFILTPVREGQKIHKSYITSHAYNLWEKFTNRSADHYYNCVFPYFYTPRFAGEIVLIRYLAEKHIDEDSRSSGPVWWEHYFDSEGDSPAYAPVWFLGRGQYYIGPGKWEVSKDGIIYLDDKEYDDVSYMKESKQSSFFGAGE